MFAIETLVCKAFLCLGGQPFHFVLRKLYIFKQSTNLWHIRQTFRVHVAEWGTPVVYTFIYLLLQSHLIMWVCGAYVARACFFM